MVCAQFVELSWAVKYIAEAVYHHFMVSREGSGEEREGTVILERQERWEAGVATSKVLSEEGGVPEDGREGAEDQGEGPSRLTTVDKGKGKEVQDEETLQEE